MRWTRKETCALTGATVLALTALPAQADVVNGGFEMGNFTGWTETGDTFFNGVDSLAARTGAFGAYFGPLAPGGGILQSFATIPNQTYIVRFSLAQPDNNQPNSFSWMWNGIAQSPSFNNSTRFPYTDFSAFVLATGPTSTLAFNFVNPQSFYFLDNVSAAVSELPVGALSEPPMVAMLGMGLLLLLASRKRRSHHA